jgi:hypothetical protein
LTSNLAGYTVAAMLVSTEQALTQPATATATAAGPVVVALRDAKTDPAQPAAPSVAAISSASRPKRSANWPTKLFNATLNNVIFGIAVMAAIGIYLALGSGLPDLRGYFELQDLAFFQTWVLKLLMGLLVATLITVTWLRIPFTPPRYGVWLVHAGIITLVFGTSFYYGHKVEGLTRVPIGQTVGHFYDTEERSLYARIDSRTSEPLPLTGMPRFHAYNPTLGNAQYLANVLRPGDADDSPLFVTLDPQSGQPAERSLTQELGIKDLSLQVLEYYPYAELRRTFEQDASGTLSGVQVTFTDAAGLNAMNDPHAGIAGAPQLAAADSEQAPAIWLVASDPGSSFVDLGGVEIEHRDIPHPVSLTALQAAVASPHQLDIKVGSYAKTLSVEVDKSYTLGDTGYRLDVQAFDPAFPMSGTGELVPVLTFLVHSQAPAPVREFRRMVLGGKSTQTDFTLDPTAAAPMGKRQKEPIDKNLNILYTLSDPQQFMPINGSEKHTFVTTTDGNGPHLYDVVSRLNGPGQVTEIPNGTGDVQMHVPGSESAPFAPFAGPMASAANPPAQPAVMRISVRRADHLVKTVRVAEVPSVQRDRDRGAVGIDQIMKVRVASGDWHQDVFVPYAEYALEDLWEEPTTSDQVLVPGARQSFTLRLGQTARNLPALLTVSHFEAIPYDGARKSGSQIMRDFRSTVEIEDRDTGEKTTGVAHLNHPVYFASGAWLFFQAQWDPQGQRFTVLGVGNRPGVTIMIAGCVMICIGLLYAFYVKPIVIARMKKNALRRAGLIRSQGRGGEAALV